MTAVLAWPLIPHREGVSSEEHAWFWILAPPLINWMTLGQFHDLSASQCLHLWNGDKMFLTRTSWGRTIWSEVHPHLQYCFCFYRMFWGAWTKGICCLQKLSLAWGCQPVSLCEWVSAGRRMHTAVEWRPFIEHGLSTSCHRPWTQPWASLLGVWMSPGPG